MNNFFRVFRRVFTRGILFTAPVALVLIILDKIVEKIWDIGAPIAELFPQYSVLGINRSYWIVIVMVLLIGLLMGLLAKVRVAANFIYWIETRFLNRIPGYQFTKQMAATMIGANETTLYKVLLFKTEDGWKISYLVEEVDEEFVALFVPNVPNPTDGELFFVNKNRTKDVGLSYKDSLKLLNSAGIGSKDFLSNKLSTKFE